MGAEALIEKAAGVLVEDQTDKLKKVTTVAQTKGGGMLDGSDWQQNLAAAADWSAVLAHAEKSGERSWP